MKADSFSQDHHPTPLLRLTFILQHLSNELLIAQAGVGLSSARIMSALHAHIPRSQQTVARVLHQTEANISRQIRQMKKQGLVNVTKNKKDARQRDIMLTKKGVQKCKQVEKLLKAQQSHLLKMMDNKDIEAFDRGLKNLLRAV